MSGLITVVEGSSFAVSGTRGDMEPELAQGVFFRDTRIISTWRLLIDGRHPEPLTAFSTAPYSATFLARAHHHTTDGDAPLFVERVRYVGGGLREDLTVRNHGPEPVDVTVTLEVGADFADLFEVKSDRVVERGERTVRVEGDALLAELRHPAGSRSVRVTAAGALPQPGRLVFHAQLPARGGVWSTGVQVRTSVDGVEVAPRFPLEHPPEHAEPARHLGRWRRDSPVLHTDWPALAAAVERSGHDLGALRISDPDHPGVAVVAAGAPWFMTLFGRDSLLASWMALPFNQQLALGTLQTLARYQGTTVQRDTEEEPGRILHEMRFGVDPSLALGGGRVYYGTADATPLFVVLLGELRRWGLAREEVDALLPAADAALSWVEDFGDRDGDGFVEYLRTTDRGLLHQGWKDSFDGINFADGTMAEPPIALAEVQGYVYAAYLARAHFAREQDDADGFTRWSRRAAELKERFNREFWLADRGYFAVALDGDKRPVDALASNMGHCLWTGLVDEDKAASVAEHLMSPAMFTGFGVRTLASTMGAYNPVSYHNGSVWPHDSALVAAGLMRYGFVEAAQRIAVGLLEAAAHFGGRLPELFCGFDRSTYPQPVPYPTSCSPQAWAAATPVQLLRTLLRIDPWVSHGRVWLDPVLPAVCRQLHLTGVPLGHARVDVHVVDGRLTVTGLPDDVALVPAPRRPLSAALPAHH